jgi:N-acetylglucosaminyldiphosphoundecaprenol N-acetyl-beta-D-mannosaminyltransferase
LRDCSILDIPILNHSIDLIIGEAITVLETDNRSNHCISATGAHGIIEAQEDPDFKKILQSFYWNLPDGMPTVWVAKLKGAKQIQRCYGPDFMKALLIASIDKPIKHFFCGGKEGVANDLKLVAENWGNAQVAGTYCPPFREMSEDEWQKLGNKINAANADVVWIGLSTPKQERFAWKLRNYCKTGFIITVGAAFDFHTGNLKQAPKWVQQVGLEWFFRLTMEPRRLYKRYLKVVPLFIWLNLKEFIDIYLLKKI